jgi:hypothetical protein
MDHVRADIRRCLLLYAQHDRFFARFIDCHPARTIHCVRDHEEEKLDFDVPPEGRYRPVCLHVTRQMDGAVSMARLHKRQGHEGSSCDRVVSEGNWNVRTSLDRQSRGDRERRVR